MQRIHLPVFSVNTFPSLTWSHRMEECKIRDNVFIPFLVGTFATQYKGSISSLVIQDFAIEISKGYGVEIKGRMLSPSRDDYEMFLIDSGKVIDRSSLSSGLFRFKLPSRTINCSRELQIDLRKGGMHIGTFLLKRVRENCSFISAIDIAEESRKFDLSLLQESAGNAYGLKRKAEGIIASTLSPRRDWTGQSEEIAEFSRSLFWFNADSLLKIFPIIVHLAFNAAIKSPEGERYRTFHNLSVLIQDLIKNEKDDGRLINFISVWLNKISDANIIPGVVVGEYVKTASLLYKRLPQIDQTILIRLICRSVEESIKSLRVIPQRTIDCIRSLSRKKKMPERSGSEFVQFTASWRNNLSRQFHSFCKGFERGVPLPDFLTGLRDFDLSGVEDAGILQNRFIEFMTEEIRDVNEDCIPSLLIEITTIAAEFNDKDALLVKRFVESSFLRLMEEGKILLCREILRGFLAKKELSAEYEMLLSEEIGVKVADSRDDELISLYCRLILNIPLASPEVQGYSSESWEEIVNPDYLKQITVIMHIVACDISSFSAALRRLFCHIRLVGILIKDNSIFPREITRFLNRARPDHNFLDFYLFLKSLPAYFNEIGATGRLRELTTRIDARGNDPLLYFLRKQTHCNASSSLVSLVEAIFYFWLSGDTERIRASLPEEVYLELQSMEIEAYSHIMRRLFQKRGILINGGIDFERLRGIDINDVSQAIDGIITGNKDLKENVLLLIEIYTLLCGKYNLLPPVKGEVLNKGKVDDANYIRLLIKKTKGLLNGLEGEKMDFLSPEETEANESIYYKRHIAFGIPSIMGSYSEKKFDALARFFRKEAELETVLEELLGFCANIKPSKGILADLLNLIDSCGRICSLHGISDPVIEEIVNITASQGLHLSQIRDMIRQFRIEVSWIVEQIQRDYRDIFSGCLLSLKRENLPQAYIILEPEKEGFSERATDQFIRELLGSIGGLNALDRFLDAYSSLITSAISLHGDICLKREKTAIAEMERYSSFNLNDMDTSDALLMAPFIGTKAKNLVILKRKGTLVPPGFVIPTYAAGRKDMDGYIQRSIARLEDETGRSFGGKRRPLLVSVRSGSYVSMPGIMASILYCGMNDTTLSALLEETGDPWFVYDSYRRFIEGYGTQVCGIDAELFKTCLDKAKAGYGYDLKKQFGPGEMHELAMQYMDIVKVHKGRIPDNAQQQLREVIKAVFHSWSSRSALKYRKIMNISDYWGTAVLVMEMISGNRKGSGTSVFFTRNPYTMEKTIFGDTKAQASGEDLVRGKAFSMPISAYQAVEAKRTMEDVAPLLFDVHSSAARQIEKFMGGLPQEIEATYTADEQGRIRLYILQTKRMEFRRGKVAKFKEICDSMTRVIAKGVGINGGALSGVAVLSADSKRIRKVRKKFPGIPVVLIRSETNTRDVGIMPEIDGLLTSLGGATSHAAVQAQKFNLSCVVGCKALKISKERGEAYIGDERIVEGDPVSIDGLSGTVYRGLCFEVSRTFI